MISSVLPLPALTETDFDNILDSLLPDGTPVASLNTKWFRESQLPHSSTLPASYLRASPTAWRLFWKASISHRAHMSSPLNPNPISRPWLCILWRCRF
ncbi:hypothetical protein G6F43_009769 [Rhizopus delemar]|nr:hypothetical protein G6F43_009769 [Rhizopus delemar]